MKTNREEILQLASNGNREAFAFLQSFARRAHWVDDLADVALGHPPFKLAEMETDWLLCLSGNSFFMAHRGQLVPAMVLALNAWVDSTAMLEPQLFPLVKPRLTPQEKGIAADVLKGQWHEVVYLVAFLTGGWDKLRALTSAYREYDFEAVSHGGPSTAPAKGEPDKEVEPQRRRDAEEWKGPPDANGWQTLNKFRCGECGQERFAVAAWRDYRKPEEMFCGKDCANAFIKKAWSQMVRASDLKRGMSKATEDELAGYADLKGGQNGAVR